MSEPPAPHHVRTALNGLDDRSRTRSAELWAGPAEPTGRQPGGAVAADRDLRAWMGRVGATHQQLRERDLAAAARAISRRQHRWLTHLALGSMLTGLGWLPLNARAALLALLLLYLGGTAILAVTARRRLAAGKPPVPRAGGNGARAWHPSTPIGVEERALLVRIMNVTRLADQPDGRQRLRKEISRARVHSQCFNLPFLDALEELLDADAAAATTRASGQP